jgi:hypothetical protein
MAKRVKIRKVEVAGVAATEVTTPKARLVVVSGFGPRISFFGRPDKENLLFWDETDKYKRGGWKLWGGHRVWNTRPGADENEETYQDDNDDCFVEPLEDGVLLVGKPHPVFRIRKALAVRVLDDETFSVENRIENPGELLWSGGVWGLTCTRYTKGNTYGIPLGDGSAWDTYALVIPRRWAGHEAPPNDPQISFNADTLVLSPRGTETKRMVQAPQGLIGMTVPTQRLSFLKRIPYARGSNYPLQTNLALYVGPKNFMVEMECMGPEHPLKPGGSLRLEETWGLRPPVAWEKLDFKGAAGLW